MSTPRKKTVRRRKATAARDTVASLRPLARRISAKLNARTKGRFKVTVEKMELPADSGDFTNGVGIIVARVAATRGGSEVGERYLNAVLSAFPLILLGDFEGVGKANPAHGVFVTPRENKRINTTTKTF